MKKAIITVPFDMSDETYNYILEKLPEKFGEQFEVTKITDKDILGGFIINIEGNVYDLSIKTQLDEMKKHITE